MITHRTGSVFETDARIIAHGVNLQGDMSGGIAKMIAHMYPTLFSSYRQWCVDAMPGDVMYYITGNWETTIIANAATQLLPGPNARLSLVYKSLTKIAQDFPVEVIAMPQIGCGIGGLQWDSVEAVLNTISDQTGAAFEVWTL